MKKLMAFIIVLAVFSGLFPPIGFVRVEAQTRNKTRSKTKPRPAKKPVRVQKIASVKFAKRKTKKPAGPIVSNSAIVPRVINGGFDKELALVVIHCDSEEIVVTDVYYTTTVSQRLMLQNGKVIAKQKDDIWGEPDPKDKTFADKLIQKFNPKELEIYPKPAAGPMGSIILAKTVWTTTEIEQIPVLVQERLGDDYRITAIPPACPQIKDNDTKAPVAPITVPSPTATSTPEVEGRK